MPIMSALFVATNDIVKKCDGLLGKLSVTLCSLPLFFGFVSIPYYLTT